MTGNGNEGVRTRGAIVWHNPRCSKSRAVLLVLEEAGVTVTERRYLDEPPTRDELVVLLRRLGLLARDLVRRGEPPYADLGLAQADEAALIDAMVRHPILIERPIVVAGDRAVVGRPPERARELFD